MKDEQTWTKLTKEIAELKEELNKIKGELTCPFCGGKVKIVASDFMGREYTEEEEKNLEPKKQLKYVLKHEEPEELSHFKEDFYANENPCTLMGIIAQNEGENEKENENVR